MKWTKRKWHINDTFEISLGKLVMITIITIFQFIGMLCDNNWIFTGSMFFLFANALFMISQQKEQDFITETDLTKFVKGVAKLIKKGLTVEEIMDKIFSINDESVES